MFLFYTLMCRNKQEYKRKSCWSQIGTFQKFVPELFSNMVTLRVEDGVKRKTPQLQSCWKFREERSRHKFNWFRIRTAEISPLHYNLRWGDENPRCYIKGGNLTRGGLLHPRITAAKSHVFASPMDPISMGEGSQEAMKEGGYGAALPYKPATGKELPASPPPLPPPCASRCPPHRLHRQLHHQILLVYSGSSSHTRLYRTM
jgi:hypothetical protein